MTSDTSTSGRGDLLIIGAGVIGLASARDALARGWRVTMVDPDFDSARASSFNAGGIGISEVLPLAVSPFSLQSIGWLLDPLGPLAVRWGALPRMLPWIRAFARMQERERYLAAAQALGALMGTVYDDFTPMMQDLGLGGELHRTGALTVYETEKGFDAERADWVLRQELGVGWREVSADELAAMEPGLARIFHRAVLVESWGIVENPKHIVDALRQQVQARGAKLLQGRAAELFIDRDGRPGARDAVGKRWVADRMIVAAGAWSDQLAASLGDRVLLTAERGYTVTLPQSRALLNSEVIFAERKFVATPMGPGLRVGGTAEFAAADAPANPGRHRALLRLARKFFPDVQTDDPVLWMGARPTTPDSLPVIGASPRHPRVLYAFGHGHVGLTLSATTARHVGRLLDDEPGAAEDLAAFSIQRFST